MNCYDHIEVLPGGREELVKDISESFPYHFVFSDHDRYQKRSVPWHWHREVEMYYVESGSMECETPHGRALLDEGDAGFVNANVLHRTLAANGEAGVRSYVHMFRPALIAAPATHLWERYVEPLTSATSIELLAFRRSDPDTRAIVDHMAKVTELALAEKNGWEMRLRDELSEAWLDILDFAAPLLEGGAATMPTPQSERLKLMLDFIGTHYMEQLDVPDIADAGFTSERECYRTFKDCLDTTPASYLHEYRLEQACRMLAHTTRPIAVVAERTGLGTASRFASAFRSHMGCTPSEYRKRWQN